MQINIKSALLIAQKKLVQCVGANAALEARILISHHLGQAPEQWMLKPDKELESPENFWELVNRRLVGEPIAYIVEKKEFYGHEFRVTQSVLIPRSDSETMIDEVLENYKSINGGLHALELGVGSGCLSISLLLEMSNLEITALDISKEALEISKQNAKTLGVIDRLELIQSDWLANVPKLYHNKFDFIISNPPYILEEERSLMAKETLNFEPQIALFTTDQLDSYKQIAKNSPLYLKQNGRIFVEIGAAQQSHVVDIFSSSGWVLRGAKNDLSGVPRILSFSQV